MIKDTNKYEETPKKFRIKEFLDMLPYKERIAANKTIPAILGISVPTYNRIVYADIYSAQEISATNLLQLARYFKCSPEELFTSPPQKFEFDSIIVCKDLNLIR